jgi:hypothetical protein
MIYRYGRIRAEKLLTGVRYFNAMWLRGGGGGGITVFAIGTVERYNWLLPQPDKRWKPFLVLIKKLFWCITAHVVYGKESA